MPFYGKYKLHKIYFFVFSSYFSNFLSSFLLW